MSDSRNRPYRYAAYGLHFKTEIPCPELPLAGSGEAPCVSVRFGCLARPPELDGEATYRTRPGELLLRLDGVATFRVTEGREIVIDPDAGADESAVRLFLLGSCLGALLQQRGLLTLHASAILTESGAVLFAGPPGIGKSTLAHHFWTRGFPSVTDDLCALDTHDDGRISVLPGYPQSKLWSDALSHFGIQESSLRRVRGGTSKFAVRLDRQFTDRPVELAAVVLLESAAQSSASCEILPGLEGFQSLVESTYRREFLVGLGLLEQHFELVATVARAVPVARGIRPQKGFHVVALADRITERLGLSTAVEEPTE